MSTIFSESMARALADGSYTPSQLESCKPELALDRGPQTLRFTEFVLFANPKQDLGSPDEPEYMIFQQYEFSGPPRSISDGLIKPMAKALGKEIDAGRIGSDSAGEGEPVAIPDDTRLPIGRLRALASERRIDGYRATLSEAGARKLVEAWVGNLREERLLSTVEPLERAGHLLNAEMAAGPKDLESTLSRVLNRVFLPTRYQPIASPHPHFTLCATFEQVWEHKGYSRGELINTISLAPGEQLTLEVHSWDKSTTKSEQELATESELRVSENLTQRDVLSVAREVSTQFGSHLDASGTINIKGVPVKFDGGLSTQVNTNLRRSMEQTRERTVQASNSLKTSRKLRIEVSREVGREQKQTHVIANTNRCHSVNCHYFEVMSNYLATTTLVSLRPCLLFPNPKVAITPAWVLCHEGVLMQALLDKAFIEGFAGARVVETYERFRQLKIEELKATGEVPDPVEQELSRHVEAILKAYGKLTSARKKIKKAAKSTECKTAAVLGGRHAWAVCVATKAGTGALRKLVYLAALQLNEAASQALDRLGNDKQAGAKSAEALGSLLAAVTPRDYKYNPITGSLAGALEDVGIPEKLVNALLSWNLIDLVADDAGLYNAVKAAAAKLEQVWEVAPAEEPGTVKEGYSTLEVAQARTAFEQLKCHIEDNWSHYMQAMWLREHPDDRFLRLQARGVVASIIDNELVGFLGRKSAYAIRDLEAVKPWIDFEDLRGNVEAEFARDETKPQLISFPTQGTVLEAVVGQCDACEDFIQTSRSLDLRSQEAKTRQEEAEARRQEMRLESNPPDLSDPSALTAGRITINLEGNPPQPPE